MSNSSAKDETIVLAAKYEWYPNAVNALPAQYQIFNSALFFPAGSVKLPVIEGKQTYGVKVWHSAGGRRVVLVQQGSAEPQAAGIKYFVLGF